MFYAASSMIMDLLQMERKLSCFLLAKNIKENIVFPEIVKTSWKQKPKI
jgi:hypothetical protein